ncbi:MAG: molybdopterin-dependent oxidoreductase [Terriglobales bacterium]|jgi:hypothetical protein
MRNRRFYPAVLLAVMVLPVLASGQQLTIQDESGKQTILARADLEALPHVKITTGSSSSPATFEGVSLDSVLEKAGVGLGETMKGKRMASYLLVEAADGYRVVFALPEIDPAFTDKRVVLAFLKDGKPLDAKEGPYRIVVPDEKRMARWVRQVMTLKIVAVP